MSARYEFIDAEKANYPIAKMCTWIGVCRAGFYEWRDRPDSATATRRAHLKIMIEAVFDDSDATYGHRRVHTVITRSGAAASVELIRRLMQEMGLQTCHPRPYRPTTTQPADDATATPDLVHRDFTAPTPGVNLVGDITYIPT